MKTRRFQKSWSTRNLPDALRQEILSNLSVKLLLHFLSVSKPWRALIDDPHFARLHLTRFNNNNRSEPPLFVAELSTRGTAECVVRSSTTLRTTATLESANTLRIDDPHWFVQCTIDGLVLLRRIGMPGLMLWNPSIRKTLNLPNPLEKCYFNLGMGFDPLTRDYKLVWLFLRSCVAFAAVYTIGTNSWKTIDFQGEDECPQWCQPFVFPYGQRTFSVRGFLFGLARRDRLITSPLELVSFDLNKELFASTGLPVVDGPSPSFTVIDGGCTLALFNVSERKGTIWGLERLGDDIKSWTWTRRYTFATYFTRSVRLLSLKKNGELLLQWENMVTSYDPETHQEKIMLKKCLRMGWPYMESLLLL